MAQSKGKKAQKKQLPVTQIFLCAAVLIVAVLIVTIFTSRNIKTDRTVLASSAQENVLLRHYMYFLNSMRFEYENSWASYGYAQSAEEMSALWKTVEDGLTFWEHLKLYALESAQGIMTELHIAKQSGYNETSDLIARTDAEIDEVVNSVFPGSNTPNTDFYKAYGLTINEMKVLQRYINLVNDWRNDIFEKTTVSDDAALAYFESNREMIDSVVARHILLMTDDLEGEEKDPVYEFACDLLDQINEGADIGELAAIYSDDGGSAENNGEYEFGRNEMVPEFEDWAFSAEVGDTGIVESSYGYHIMQLMRAPYTFDELKDEVINAVKSEAATASIEDAVANAGIDWKLNESAFGKINMN